MYDNDPRRLVERLLEVDQKAHFHKLSVFRTG